jgi:hypothetical protein
MSEKFRPRLNFPMPSLFLSLRLSFARETPHYFNPEPSFGPLFSPLLSPSQYLHRNTLKFRSYLRPISLLHIASHRPGLDDIPGDPWLTVSKLRAEDLGPDLDDSVNEADHTVHTSKFYEPVHHQAIRPTILGSYPPRFLRAPTKVCMTHQVSALRTTSLPLLTRSVTVCKCVRAA